jgi:hypothetical protein
MSEIGQGQKEHHPSIELSLNNSVSIASTTAAPLINDRPPPNRNPRLGELFVDVPLDEGLLKGGIAPHKFQHLWCKQQVRDFSAKHCSGVRFTSSCTLSRIVPLNFVTAPAFIYFQLTFRCSCCDAPLILSLHCKWLGQDFDTKRRLSVESFWRRRH